MLDRVVAEPLTAWGADDQAVPPVTEAEFRAAGAPGFAEFGRSVPMDRFPARLRLGRAIDHLDIVVGEFVQTAGVEEVWEHSATVTGESLGVQVRRPGLWCGGADPS